MGQIADTVKASLGSFGPALGLVFAIYFALKISVLSRFASPFHGILKKGGRNVGKPLGSVVGRYAKEGQIRLARRGGTLGWIAGRGLRRDARIASRERERVRAEEDYIEGYTREHPRYAKSSAGVSGKEGVTSVQASAAATAMKSEDQKLTDAVTLLTKELKDFGIDQKTLAGGLRDYLSDPTGVNARTGLANNLIRGQGGKNLDLSTLDPALMRAALHTAAGQGEVMTIAAARTAVKRDANGNVVRDVNGNLVSMLDQSMVDDIIYRNDATIKSKGGYHLATDWNLAIGRGLSNNNLAQAQQQMAQAHLNALAESSAEDLANMKSGVVVSLTNSLKSTANGGLGLVPLDRSGNVDPNLIAKLDQTLNQAINNRNLSAKLSQNLDALRDANTDYLANPNHP